MPVLGGRLRGPAQAGHRRRPQGNRQADQRHDLTTARRLLDDLLAKYDRTGLWQLLDERTTKLEIYDVSEPGGAGLSSGPFPIALMSLQFNRRYMKRHGVHACYEMTARYVDDQLVNTRHWTDAWAAEAKTGVIDRITTVECDLASEEAPMHCDICKKTITALVYLEE